MAGKIKVPSELVPSQSNKIMLRSKYIYDDIKGHTQEEVNAALEEQIESKVIEAGGVNWDTVPTAGSNNAVKSKDIKAALEKVTGYFVLDSNVTESTVAKTVTVADFPALAIGGSIKIKMLTKNTATNPTLRIGPSTATAYPLYYNEERASGNNSWEANEIISVFFDGANYRASNSQGGGGKAEKIKYDNSQSGLAAENVQGALDKIISNTDTFELVDIYCIKQLSYFITGAGVWTATSQSLRYYCKIIAIEPNTRYKITAKKDKKVMYALLDSDEIDPGSTATDWNGGSSKYINVGESEIFESGDYTYLYLRYGDSLGTIDYPKSVEKILTADDQHKWTITHTISSEVVDTTNYNLIGLSTGANKKWENTYKGFVIPVNAGEVYDIIPNENTQAIILPLNKFTWELNVSYADDIASGYSDRVVIPIGVTYTFVVPSDCVCLYVQTIVAGPTDSTPTIIKRRTVSQFDATPIVHNKNGVTSNGVFNSTYVNVLPLRIVKAINTYQLSSTMQWNQFSSSSDTRNSAIYYASEGDVIHLTAVNGATYYAFLQATNTIQNNNFCTPSSGRYLLLSGESVDIVAPKNTNYLYVTTFTTANGNITPLMSKYTKTSDAVNCKGFKHTILGYGGNDNFYSLRATLKAGGIYRVALDKQDWSITSIDNSHIWFSLLINNSYVERITKSGKGKPKSVYYFYVKEDSDFYIAVRADAGESITLTVDEVTNEFNKQIYDVYFVDGETVSESMMVKVGIGDLVKYKLNADAEMTVIKMYSKAVRDDNYLVDSITAEEAGVLEGQFMPTSEVFVTMESVISSGFTSFFRVYNYGKAEENKIVFPYQFIVDPDGDIFDTGEGGGKKIIFSTDDETTTSYDDGLINYGQIIPDDGIYYMLYQAFGATSHKSPNICFAYSSDGLNWTKGIPQGIEAPIAGTNVIFDRSNTYSVIPEFAENKVVVNEFAVAVVNDINNKYRMFCAARNVPDYSHDPDGTIVGMCHYLLKSNDLVHWSVVRKVTTKPHDTFSSMFCYGGDKLKIYLRMWDYNQTADKQRMVGVMWLDIWGNVIVPASGIGFRGDYSPAATRINPTQDLLLPTRFYAGEGESIMLGSDNLESYIVDGDKIRYAPSYNLDRIKDGDVEGGLNGWTYVSGLVAIGMKQYLVCGVRELSHGVSAETQKTQLRLYPIKWITYDSYNTSGDVG